MKKKIFSLIDQKSDIPMTDGDGLVVVNLVIEKDDDGHFEGCLFWMDKDNVCGLEMGHRPSYGKRQRLDVDTGPLETKFDSEGDLKYASRYAVWHLFGLERPILLYGRDGDTVYPIQPIETLCTPNVQITFSLNRIFQKYQVRIEAGDEPFDAIADTGDPDCEASKLANEWINLFSGLEDTDGD